MINDPEIDLTEHRDFGRNQSSGITFITRNGARFSNIGNFIRNSFLQSRYGSIPWNVVPLHQEEMPLNYDGILALGNKHQRKEAKLTRTWGTADNITCDCCGKKYTKIPWKKDWGLCKECDEANRPSVIIPWEINEIQQRLGWIENR